MAREFHRANDNSLALMRNTAAIFHLHTRTYVRRGTLFVENSSVPVFFTNFKLHLARYAAILFLVTRSRQVNVTVSYLQPAIIMQA